MEYEVPKFLRELETAFNAAMISNDSRRIAACITEDWALVTPERGPISRDDILSAIACGVLSHDTMSKKLVHAKVIGDVAFVTGRGQNTGIFRGEPISADEWITDIYQKTDNGWKCVLTHLTPAEEA
jgi:ketosteroid isomerase-like protein